MWAEREQRRNKQVLRILLSISDINQLKTGGNAGERIGITQSDAVIEVNHLRNQMRRPSQPMQKETVVAPPSATLLTNGDLAVYLSETQIGHLGDDTDELLITRDAVTTPILGGISRNDLLEACIPAGGIVIDTSLRYSLRSHPH